MPVMELSVPRAEYVNTKERALEVLRLVREAGLAGYDTETTGIDIRTDVVVFWSLALDNYRWCLSVDMLKFFEEMFQDPKMILVGNNLSMFDYHVTRNTGIKDIKCRLWDTLVMNTLLGHQAAHSRGGLKEQIEDRFGRKMPSYDSLFKKVALLEILENAERRNLDPDMSQESLAELAASVDAERNLLADMRLHRVSKEQKDTQEARLAAAEEHYKWQKLFLDMIQYSSRDPWENLQLVVDPDKGMIKDLSELPADITLNTRRTMWDQFLEYEEAFSMVLARMTWEGMLVDVGLLADMRPGFEKRLVEIHTEFVRMAGKNINLSSPKQLASFFYEDLGKEKRKFTKGGKSGIKNPSVDVEVLEGWADDGDPYATVLREYRKISKLLSTYINGLEKWVDDNLYIHTKLQQNKAATGRLASSEPNLQNIPIRTKEGRRIREAFISEPGYILLSADYAQLEMRIMADFSEDENMIQAIKEGKDLHCNTVALVDHLEYLDVVAGHLRAGGKCPALLPNGRFCESRCVENKDEYGTDIYTCPTCGTQFTVSGEDMRISDRRRGLKAVGFGILYGEGEVKLAGELGLPLVSKVSRAGRAYTVSPEGKALINQYFSAYPRVQVWIDGAHNFCREFGYVETFLGRRRWIPEIWSGNRTLMKLGERQAQNCVDAETEALTQHRGWVKGFELRKDETILTKNPETGILEWQKMTALKLYPDYEGPLVEFSSKTFSAVSNPDHRWLVRDKKSGKDSCKTTADLVRRADGGGDLKIHRTGYYPGPHMRSCDSTPVQIYEDDFVELVGWVVTDGWYSEGDKVCIGQSERANPEKVARIDALLERIGMNHGRWVGKEDDCARWSFSGALAKKIKSLLPNKRIDQLFLSNLARRQLELLLDTMVLADGTGWDDEEQRSHLRFHTINEEEANIFQILAALCGYASNKVWRDVSKYEPRSDKLKNVPHCDGYWVITLLRRKYTQLDRHQVREFYNKQPIWCPVVPNTYFVARRQGKVFITGNTPIQGTAADIAKAAMLRCAEHAGLVHDLQTTMRLQVHDEIIFTRPDDGYTEQAIAVIKELMEDPFHGRWTPRQIRVPLVAEVGTGYSWATAH